MGNRTIPAQRDDVDTTTTHESLPFKLSQEQIADKGRELGKLSSELDRLNEEFSEVRKEHKLAVGNIESQMDELFKAINDGEEERTVECIERKNYTQGIVQYEYMGDVLKERPITADERQMRTGL